MDGSQTQRENRRRLQPYLPQSCARCGSIAGFHAVNIEDENTGCLILVFGGLLPYMFYNSSVRGRIQCENCGFIFRPITRTRLGKHDFLVVFLILGAVLGTAVYFLIATTR